MSTSQILTHFNSHTPRLQSSIEPDHKRALASGRQGIPKKFIREEIKSKENIIADNIVDNIMQSNPDVDEIRSDQNILEMNSESSDAINLVCNEDIMDLFIENGRQFYERYYVEDYDNQDINTNDSTSEGL